MRWSGLKYETEYTIRFLLNMRPMRSNYHNDGQSSITKLLVYPRLTCEASTDFPLTAADTEMNVSEQSFRFRIN